VFVCYMNGKNSLLNASLGSISLFWFLVLYLCMSVICLTVLVAVLRCFLVLNAFGFGCDLLYSSWVSLVLPSSCESSTTCTHSHFYFPYIYTYVYAVQKKRTRRKNMTWSFIFCQKKIKEKKWSYIHSARTTFEELLVSST
jgi:hypothetical protein